MRRLVIPVLMLALSSPMSLFGRQHPQILRNKDVVTMLKAGLTPDIVIAKIKSSHCHFGTSPTTLENLKKEGVPNTVILAMVSAPAAKENSPSTEPPLPTVSQILEKYIAALGGRAAIEKTTSRIETGTFRYKGRTGTFAVYSEAPNKLATVTNVPGIGTIREGFDGTSAWAKYPNSDARELTGQESGLVRRSAEFHGLLEMKELYPQMTLEGQQTIGGRTAYAIKAKPGDGSVQYMYFDTRSGLLVRSDTTYDSGGGQSTTTWTMKNYEAVNGVKIPFAKVERGPNGTVTYTYSKVSFNVPISNQVFVKPPETPEPGKAHSGNSPVAPNTLRAIAWRAVPWTTTSYYQEPGSSYTNCTGQGQWLGNVFQNNLSCTGSTTPAQSIPLTWYHYTIYNLVETDAAYALIACTRNWRWSKCSYLVPGSVFSYRSSNGEVWITAHPGKQDKEKTVKYKLVAMKPITAR